MDDLENRIEVWKTYVNKIGEMFLNEEYNICQKFQKDSESFSKFKEKYEKEFIKYKTEERFTIPIIGIISSGKSTFLNVILQNNYLETDTKEATKFICILRHNRFLREPKLYKAYSKRRRIDYKYKKFEYFSFEKRHEVEEVNGIKGDIKKLMQEINKNIAKYEEKMEISQRDINKYFYILEVNIPLFSKEEYKSLGNYFDFIDIPGLNEEKSFISKNIIPMIVNKCLFSIYIFEMGRYESKPTLDIYKEYISGLNTYEKKSIYILNKIDIIHEDNKYNDDEKKYLEEFKEYLTNDNSEFKVNKETNYFLKTDSKSLYNKVNAKNNFETFFDEIISGLSKKEIAKMFQKKFILFLKESLIKNFSINDNQIKEIFEDSNGNYSKYFDANEYNIIKNKIIGFNIPAKLGENEYNKIKYIYYNFEKIVSNIPDDLHEIYKIILSCMKTNFDTFFDFKKVHDLFDIFLNSLKKIFIKREQQIKIEEFCEELKVSFLEELKKKKELRDLTYNLKLVKSLEEIISSLISLDPENDLLKKLKDNFDSFSFYLYNAKKIRIPLLGGYSTGKSSFLNSLIGKEILPIDVRKCTYRGIIIRHTNEKNIIQLFKTKFIKIENPTYWYFQDEEAPICEGYEEVKQELIKLNNKEPKFEDAFVILKINLNIFDEIEASEELKNTLKNKVELIDFPGLDTLKNFYEETIFAPLMNFSDGFIFVNDCDLIKESGNINILRNIVNEINLRISYFSYNSRFFLIQKCDKKLQLDIKNSKKDFGKILEIKKFEELNVDKFSSKLFKTYTNYFNRYVKNFELCLKYIIENSIEEDEIENIKDYKDFLSLISQVLKEEVISQIDSDLIADEDEKLKKNILKPKEVGEYLKKYYSKYIVKENNIIDEDITENNSEITTIIDDIYNDYLYINKYHKFQNQRVLSNANNLFKSIFILFENAYEEAKNKNDYYFNQFINSFNDLFILTDIKLFGRHLDGQYDYNMEEQKYLEIKEKLQRSHQELLKFFEKRKKELKEDNENQVNSFVEKILENSEEKIFKEFEDKIKSNINKASSEANNKKIEFFNLIKEVIKNIRSYTINSDFYKISVNRKFKTSLISLIEPKTNNDRDFESFFAFYATLISNIIICFIDSGIFIKNLVTKNSAIRNNLNEYMIKANEYIDDIYKKYILEIEEMNNEAEKTIENIININENKFEGIKKNSSAYKKIKDEYYKILLSKK